MVLRFPFVIGETALKPNADNPIWTGNVRIAGFGSMI